MLKKSGEQDWRNRISKKQDVAKVAVGDQDAHFWETEQRFKKKVTTSLLTQPETSSCRRDCVLPV